MCQLSSYVGDSADLSLGDHAIIVYDEEARVMVSKPATVLLV